MLIDESIICCVDSEGTVRVNLPQSSSFMSFEERERRIVIISREKWFL